ncbi:hypothetical protein P3S68_018821 [Capsicum galapagoense]
MMLITSDLQLGGTPSSASDLPTPVHPPSLDPQLGDRDDYGRLYLIPFATEFRTDAKKFYWRDDANTCLIRRNFFRRCRVRFNGLLDYALTKLVKPSWISEPLWQQYIHLWNSEGYQLLREKGRKARTSSKGGSLHTAGARSTLAVQEKLEKENGKSIPQDELFKETHLKKKKNLTDEDVWVEPRVKVFDDKYRQLVNEYRSTQPPES